MEGRRSGAIFDECDLYSDHFPQLKKNKNMAKAATFHVVRRTNGPFSERLRGLNGPFVYRAAFSSRESDLLREQARVHLRLWPL